MSDTMKALADDFRQMRRVSTPWCIVKTSDYRAMIRELVKVRMNGEEAPNAYQWDCVNSVVKIQGDHDIDFGDPSTPPSDVLKIALEKMPESSILFLIVPDDATAQQNFWSNPFTAQATANLRDHFKADRRMLVILSIDGKLPALIADDVPLLVEPLPTKDELHAIATGLCEQWDIKTKGNDLEKAPELCLGMNRFAAEESVSRKLSKKNGVDLEGLALAQRDYIEQSSERALMFERGKETFADIGGLAQIKEFTELLFNGKRPPTCIVKIEEIEKAMGGIGHDGAGGDTSGTSLDQLGVLLTAMEDNGWDGFIAAGHAGTGKSLVSKAMGNTHKVPSITFDLGACKGQYVGQSEARIRKAVSIIKSFAGNGAFFVATSNNLDIIPAALRRRFRSGVWMFDLPTKEEREAIWQINLKRYELDANQPRPDDTDFTGSDIRNVCDLAYRLCCPLKQARKFIVPVAKSDPAAILKLREAADGKFLSASTDANDGVYRKPEKATGRAKLV